MDSNDVLYGGDEEFNEELKTLVNKLVELILEQLASLKSDTTSIVTFLPKSAPFVFVFVQQLSPDSVK